MAAQMPMLIAFGIRGKYLEYVAQENRQGHKRVRLTSKMLLSETRFTKFEVIRSKSFPDMVHIRTCYNRKFLRLETHGGTWIAPAADEPEEDRAKWSCTLFRPVYSNNNNLGLVLQSQNAEYPVSLSSSTLCIARNTGNPSQLFEIADLTRQLILPKHVNFKGSNGLYLRARSNHWLQFYTDNPLDPKAHMVSRSLPNGDARLESIRYNLLWKTVNNNDHVKADGALTELTQHTLFRPVRLSHTGSTIGLKSVAKNRFCICYPSGINAGYLMATSATAVPQADITVGEAIRSRLITDVKYKLDEARIHNLEPVPGASRIQNVRNDTNSKATQTVTFSFQQVTEETFNSTHTWKLAVNMRVTAKFVPVLVQGEVKLEASASGEHRWSETTRTSQTTTFSVSVEVPPRSQRTVTMIVSQGKIDVPFSYKQEDILIDGQVETTVLQDGIFDGFNTYVSDVRITSPETAVDRIHYAPSSQEEGEEEVDDDHDHDDEQEAVRVINSRIVLKELIGSTDSISMQDCFCDVVATVKGFDFEDGWWYNACKNCNKKVFYEESSMGFYCKECVNIDNTPSCRYKVTCKVIDDEAEAYFIMFDPSML